MFSLHKNICTTFFSHQSNGGKNKYLPLLNKKGNVGFHELLGMGQLELFALHGLFTDKMKTHHAAVTSCRLTNHKRLFVGAVKPRTAGFRQE